ncbi:unnamed protein product [Miscanthus lutarioriparius]|uniref:Uncharacterized protein n=1 Tax=Miscanthus lutarioriparius TaxID=422564 RepID=A0A811N9L5_9POAL|nr:unnamed protein product [Miscanthus lutarioriparius]
MAEQLQLRDRALRIFMNEGKSWYGMNHHHPTTFDTLAMDPALKQSIIADLDRFLGRRDYYRRIGKAWKRGYLLYGPPGTGKSSLVAAMANYLRFNLYDLDLSEVRFNSDLQKLLVHMPNKSILDVEDIECSFEGVASREREDGRAPEPDMDADYGSDGSPPVAYYSPPSGTTLSGLLNYKDRLDPALLRPGRMDMHVYMGYCCWEAFKTLARNYFLVDNHTLFPEIQELLSAVDVTPAEVSEMLLRSEDVDVALQPLVEFPQKKRQRAWNETENKKAADDRTYQRKQCKRTVPLYQMDPSSFSLLSLFSHELRDDTT